MSKTTGLIFTILMTISANSFANPKACISNIFQEIYYPLKTKLGKNNFHHFVEEATYIIDQPSFYNNRKYGEEFTGKPKYNYEVPQDRFLNQSASLIHTKMHSPIEYKEFIRGIFLDIEKLILKNPSYLGRGSTKADVYRFLNSRTLPLPLPRRLLYRVIHERLKKYDLHKFNKVNAKHGITDTETFRGYFRDGKVFFDSAAAKYDDAHGGDSHILQVLYVAEDLENMIGPGSTKRLLKHFASAERGKLWSHLFDNHRTQAFLGNPAVFNELTGRFFELR